MGEARLKAFVGALTVLAAALCASWVYAFGVTFDQRLLVGAAIFASFILVGELLSTGVNERLTVSPVDVGLVAAVVVVGPVWAILAALPTDLLVGRRSLLRSAYEVSHSAVIILLAGVVYSFVADPLLIQDIRPSAELFYGVLVAGTVLVAANMALDSLLLKVKYDQAFRRSWEENVQPHLLPHAVDVFTAGLGAMALLSYGPVGILMVFVGSLGSQALVYQARQKKEKIEELQERAASLERTLATSNATFGTMMVQELGRKDGYTHRHAAATAVYATDLAGEMKFDGPRTERLWLAGLLHNIGMFGLPEELLMSADRLNSIAQYQVAEHPIRGEKMLGAMPEYEEMASWVRWHHERPDGRGYPDNLRGPWIPLEAKVLAVAQAYAAMVLDGPRRAGISPVKAREELCKGTDTQFDGIVVRAFLRILDTETEGYRMADDQRFAFPAQGSREFQVSGEDHGSAPAAR